MRSNDAHKVFGRHNDKPCRLGGSAAARYLGAKLYGLGSYDNCRVCQGFSSILMHLICMHRAQSADAKVSVMLTMTLAVSAGRWHGEKACTRVCSDSRQLKTLRVCFWAVRVRQPEQLLYVERGTGHAQVGWGCDPKPYFAATRRRAQPPCGLLRCRRKKSRCRCR